MADPNKDFINVTLSKEDYEAFMEWSREFQNTYKTRFHKGYLAELLKNGTNCIRDLKTKQQVNTHTSSKMQGGKDIGDLHLKVINRINEKWALDKLEDKTTFKVAHNLFKTIIREVFNKFDNRTLNSRRDEILPLLDLEVIQEKGKWYIVHKTYEQQIKEKPLVKVPGKTKANIELFIDKIKNKKDWMGKKGLTKIDIKRGCKNQDEFKLFLQLAAKEGIYYDEESERYLYEDSPKLTAENEANLALANMGRVIE